MLSYNKFNVSEFFRKVKTEIWKEKLPHLEFKVVRDRMSISDDIGIPAELENCIDWEKKTAIGPMKESDIMISLESCSEEDIWVVEACAGILLINFTKYSRFSQLYRNLSGCTVVIETIDKEQHEKMT